MKKEKRDEASGLKDSLHKDSFKDPKESFRENKESFREQNGTPLKNRLISDDDMLLSDFQDGESSIEKKKKQSPIRGSVIEE